MDWRNIVYNKNMTTLGKHWKVKDTSKFYGNHNGFAIGNTIWKGKKRNQSSRDKMSEALKGNTRNLGRKHTDIAKRKYSESKKGEKNPRFGVEVSILTRKKMSNSAKKGVESHFWIKDRTQLKKSDDRREDTQNIYWRREIRKRDANKCTLASEECKGRIEVHHIFDWINYPKLRYIINNGITLCAFHHPRGREKEKRMIPIFQELLSVSKNQNL